MAEVQFGTEGPDTLSYKTGTDFPQEIYGLGGNDTIRGSFNFDRLFGGDGDDIIRGNEFVPQSGFSDADVLGGGAGNDQLFGASDHDTLFGGDGADSMDGGAGDDVLYADFETTGSAPGTDTMRGGDGNDVYISYDGNFAIWANDPGVDRLECGVNVSIEPWQIEDLTLIGSAVEGNGNLFGNTIRGNGVANILRGMNGGDRLYGFEGDDTLDGGNGVDELYGSIGNDTYYVNAFHDTVFENSNEGFDKVIATTSYSLESSGAVEDLILDTGATNGTGNALANHITGNSANNTLRGLAEADTLEGGVGNDLYVLDDVTAAFFLGEYIGHFYDTVIEGADGGVDTVWVSRQPTGMSFDIAIYELRTNVEDGTVIGSGDFDLTGNELNNRLRGNDSANILAGRDGNDSLEGSLGADRLEGGAGNDRYTLGDLDAVYFDGVPVIDIYDEVVEFAGQGLDTVLVGRQRSIVNPSVDVVSYALGANVENGEVTGGGAFDLIGNELANRLTGNDAENVLSGGEGNDTLEGGGEGDTLEGGGGNDVYRLNDVYTLFFNGQPIGDFFDTVQEAAGGAIDTVHVGAQRSPSRPNIYIARYTLADNVENGAVTGTRGFDLIGNTSDNVLTGNRGDDLLVGAAGQDVLTGGLGSDSLRGGGQSDRFDYDSIGQSGRIGGVITQDTIADFRHLIDDIDVRDIDARANQAGNNVFTFIGGLGFSGEGQIRAVQSGADTIVSFNTTGTAGFEMSIRLNDFTAANLTAEDFLL